jgi:hypothetical protein
MRRTVEEMIDYLCEALLIEHQDGTLPDEVYIELRESTKRMKQRGDDGKRLTKEQLNMPWDQFVAEMEITQTRQ